MKKQSGVIIAGLALFSMFFGAGDLIWPLILGGTAGDKNFYAMVGLLISGVSLPLLGLIAMMLFKGDWRGFFGQTGKIPGIILIFIIQAILGPFGSLPRLITLSFASLKTYMPGFVTLPVFSILSCIIVYLFTIKRHRVVDIMGIILSPLLLVSLGAILIVGFIHPPAATLVSFTPKEAFFSGLNVGYNTLDLIASFIFAPLVLAYFITEKKEDSLQEARSAFKKMSKACLLAAGLLATMYFGLTYVASYYTPYLPTHAPEERLAAISLYLLGSKGALFSCMTIALSCLTTAIPISAISASYIHEDLSRKKINLPLATAIALGLSSVVANMGFMGIAAMLSPVLQMLCPGLIILSILNILHKLYEMRMRKLPVYAAFALSTIGYLVR
jgi:LIVCS family branched-chain amino acid:cation transporter